MESDTVNRDAYTTRYVYDVLNRVEKIINKHEGVDVYTQYQYDEVGNKVKERRERSDETQYAYDSMNRLQTVTDAKGKTFTYGYDLAGNKVTETNAKGDTITYSYDKLNRIETIKDPYGIIVERNGYDPNGNITKKTDAKGNETRYTYDLANRLVKVVDPEAAEKGGYTAVYQYNPFGEKIKEIDGLGAETQYQYDEAGRLVLVTDALGTSIQYGYNKVGGKIHMTDGRGKVTRYHYGAFGLLKTVIDPEDSAITYKYDLVGNTVHILDRNGNETLYTYDSRNQLQSKNIPVASESIQYTYDAMGNRSSMIDATGTSRYSYDENNRLTSITKEGIIQLTYAYDAVGNIETITDRLGFATTYTYDKSSRMKTVVYNTSQAVKTITYRYDPNGNRESIEYEGGVKEEYTYDKNNRLLTLINQRPDSSLISKYVYTYDLAGRQATKTDTYGTESTGSYGTTTYSYDQLGRIEKVETPGQTAIYTYDKAGNRLSLNETYTSDQTSGYQEVQYIVKKSEYVYSDNNRLLKRVERMFDKAGAEVLQKTTAYQYDNNGNQLTQTSQYISPHTKSLRESTRIEAYGDGIENEVDTLVEEAYNEFDGFNRLKKVESIKSGARTTTEYSYNGDDVRVRKVVKKSTDNYIPVETCYLYDRQHVVLETDEAGALKTRYIRGVNYIARMDSTNKHSYFLYNGHGDVVQTVTETGEVENQYDYDTWGNATLTVQQYDCAIRYAGEYFDSETGLYYLRARYYDSYIGRFISEDSYWGEDANPLSLNRYTYCENDPVLYF